MLAIEGLVARPCVLSLSDLAALPARWQVADVGQLVPGRKGQAVYLAGLLEAIAPQESARWLTLHAAADDFHASIPLEAVRERAVLVYALGGEPLPVSAGGPFRFLIPDFAACRVHEIDECANVKFVDRLQFTAERGQDNRPHDAAEHAALHDRQAK